MKYSFKNAFLFRILGLIVFIFSITSCNKTLERYQAAEPVVQNSLTINNFLTTDTSFSLLNALIIRAGLSTTLSDVNTTFTLFAPTNAAFRAAGFTTTAIVAALPVPTALPLAQYMIVPGREFSFTGISSDFPNMQLPTLFNIGVLTGTTIPFNVTIFPSKRGGTVWVNNTPAVAFDMRYRNGTVHTLSAIINPPSAFLANLVAADAQLTMFNALITRADQTVPSANLLAALNNPGANLTLFAPNNTAMKAFVNAASGGAVPLTAPDATFLGFIGSSLPAQNAQGIVLTHILGVRAFSVNLPSTATKFLTLLNGGIPTHPGISIQSVFATGGLSVTTINVIGNGNGGLLAVSTPAANFDKLAINGVMHITDRVLLP